TRDPLAPRRMIFRSARPSDAMRRQRCSAVLLSIALPNIVHIFWLALRFRPPRGTFILIPVTMPARWKVKRKSLGHLLLTRADCFGQAAGPTMIFPVPSRELIPKLVSHPGLDLQSSQTS